MLSPVHGSLRRVQAEFPLIRIVQVSRASYIWHKTKDFITQQKFAEFQKAKGNLTLWPDGSYLPFDTPTIQSPYGVVGPGTKQEIA
jgi:hypothetical protein